MSTLLRALERLIDPQRYHIPFPKESVYQEIKPGKQIHFSSSTILPSIYTHLHPWISFDKSEMSFSIPFNLSFYVTTCQDASSIFRLPIIFLGSPEYRWSDCITIFPLSSFSLLRCHKQKLKQCHANPVKRQANMGNYNDYHLILSWCQQSIGAQKSWYLLQKVNPSCKWDFPASRSHSKPRCCSHSFEPIL